MLDNCHLVIYPAIMADKNKITQLNYKWITELYLANKSNKEIEKITGYKQQSVINAIKKIKAEIQDYKPDDLPDLVYTSIQDSLRTTNTINNEYMVEFVRLQVKLDNTVDDDALRLSIIDQMINLSKQITNNHKNVLQSILRMGVSLRPKDPKGSQCPDKSGNIVSHGKSTLESDIAEMKAITKRLEDHKKEKDG